MGFPDRWRISPDSGRAPCRVKYPILGDTLDIFALIQARRFPAAGSGQLPVNAGAAARSTSRRDSGGELMSHAGDCYLRNWRLPHSAGSLRVRRSG